MINFVCNTCNDTKSLQKAIIKVIDGKVRTQEAYCEKCNDWMQEVDKDFDGFPSLIRTEPSLSKRRDNLWKGAKEKLVGERGINDDF